MAIKADDFGLRMCEIFDLDPDMVGAIRIDVTPGNVFEINVTLRPSLEQSVSFGDVIKDIVIKQKGPGDNV